MKHSTSRHSVRQKPDTRPYNLPLPSEPILKPPSFNHGSLSHVILAFSRALDKAFTVEQVQKFLKGEKTPHDIKRALKVLEGNKSVEKLNDSYWAITRTGLCQLNDMQVRQMKKLSSGKK